MLKDVLAILVGYFLGTISPAYFLGKYFKHFDIRTVGTKNAGARNVAGMVRAGAGVATGAIDFSKGIAAILIAGLLTANPIVIGVAGIAAVLGHIFPFYLKFNGGQGAATSSGILIYYLTGLMKFYPLPILAWLILGIMISGTLILTKKVDFLPFFVLPVFAVIVYLNYSLSLNVLYVYIATAYLFGLNLYENLRLGILNFGSLIPKTNKT